MYAIFFILSLLLSSGMSLPVNDHPSDAKRSADKPLSITGRINQVRLHKLEGTMVIDVSMTVHFKNHSSTPLLVFVRKDWPLQGGATLASSRENAISKKYVFVSGAWPSSDRPAWEETRRKLDQESPPTDLIRSIEPGAEWSFDKSVVLGVETAGSFDNTSKPWNVIKSADPLWLQLEFMMWPNNLEQNMLNPRFGRRLQKRWKGQGQLVIGNIVSEPIPLSLPPE
ncbi:MAG TPA: hypothetical protein VMU05_13205 [Dongiaceae bacterium]|nr:hypothetical protein [Dongiaceae bacterium]